MQEYKMLIGDAWEEAASGERMAVVNPADDKAFAFVPKSGPEDVDKAVAAALEAGPDWANRPVSDRSKILLRLSALIRDHIEDLAELETLEQGSPIRKTREMDIPQCAEYFEYYAGVVRGMTGETLPIGPWCTSMTVHEPLGVIGLITPWNFPALMVIWKLGAAVATGNTCVVKPPSIAPITALKFGGLAIEAGIPPGVINIVTGPGSTVGEAMVRHSDISKIGFTGDSLTGKRITVLSSESIKPIGLELGGKNPFIVLADADVDAAVEGAVWGAFFNSGQVCAAASRFYIHETLYNRFAEKFVAATKTLRMGDPMNPLTVLGPLASREHRDKIEAHIADAKRSGAKLLLGGERPDTPETRAGYFMAPTIFGDCTNDMSFMREEMFGPVVGLVPFQTAEEAVDMANDSKFGLAGSVWTKDLKRGLTIAGKIKAGTVWINEHLFISCETPWGGCKESGWGKDASTMALEEYTMTKHVYVDLMGHGDRPWYGMLK